MQVPARVRATYVGAICLGLLLGGLVRPTIAQTTTATIQGTVTDDQGALQGATVVAREQQSGFQYEAVSDQTGRFTLGGLRPGTYEITATMDQFKPQKQTRQILLGQTISVEFKLSTNIAFEEQVEVVGNNLQLETRTSQISTNVTQDQIRLLPQNSRNFLNFAALAPGVRVSDTEFKKEVTSGGLTSNMTNVFIDGVSYKNDIVQGGVIGQDASRGNPFPQNAVQEFQVLTQNYKAEYEKAGSAVIAAITKSGGNRWSGELFNFYQDKSLVEREFFSRQRNLPRPEYQRWQWGASLGGPIVPNKMQIFATFEENRQDRDGQVVLGTIGGGNQPPPALLEQLRTFEGTFTSPFRSRLLFSKLSSQPQAGHNLEVTYNLRHETDIRAFGGQGGPPLTSFQAAENARNRVDSALGKYQISGARLLNETFFGFQRNKWSPTSENPDIIGQDYQGLARIGGRETTQSFIQKRYSLRNDASYFTNWNGAHTVKFGGVASLLQYEGTKFQFGNPLFTFTPDISWDFPARAQYGLGNPTLSTNNWQVGFFAQDDWRIGSHLTLNLGVRWDFETDMLNNDYVTPENIIAATSPFVDPTRYFTDGNDRPPFYNAWQPRLGFSYDVTGSGNSVVFGGYGRNYDRVLFNSVFDERFRLQFDVRSFLFSRDGGLRDGQETLIWDPSFLSVAGLDGIIASGRAPNAEVFLLANDTKPPVTDQFTVGVRQRIRNTTVSASYAGLRARNDLTFLRGNRNPDGTCCASIPGFSNIFISSDDKEAWFDAFYLQIDKPYGAGGGRWGYSVTYTLSEATQNGGDLFSLDFPTVADYPRYPSNTDERHRVVATGIVGLPWDFVLSTFVTLGSGLPFTITDESQGTGANERRVLRNEGRPEQFSFILPDAWAYRSVDLRLEKVFRFNQTQQIALAFDGFNIFSFENFTDFDGSIPPEPSTNPNFGRPRQTLDPGRRLQFGVRYMF